MTCHSSTHQLDDLITIFEALKAAILICWTILKDHHSSMLSTTQALLKVSSYCKPSWTVMHIEQS